MQNLKYDTVKFTLLKKDLFCSRKNIKVKLYHSKDKLYDAHF